MTYIRGKLVPAGKLNAFHNQTAKQHRFKCYYDLLKKFYCAELLQATPLTHSEKIPCNECLLDKLRSVDGTYTFRGAVKELQEEGVDFTQHLYVPEVDPVTGRFRHGSSGHNHLLKRIAQHIRDGGILHLTTKHLRMF